MSNFETFTDEQIAELQKAINARMNPPLPTWGETIDVLWDQKPYWLGDREVIQASVKGDGGVIGLAAGKFNWPFVASFRLHVGHPYYLAVSRGFEYWPGGEASPKDWDESDILLRNGTVLITYAGGRGGLRWDHRGESVDIVGIRRKAAKPERPVWAVKPEWAAFDWGDPVDLKQNRESTPNFPSVVSGWYERPDGFKGYVMTHHLDRTVHVNPCGAVVAREVTS